MLHINSLQKSQAHLKDENSEIFFVNICKVREYYISLGIEFHLAASICYVNISIFFVMYLKFFQQTTKKNTNFTNKLGFQHSIL